MRWLCDVSNVAFGIGNATCCLVAIGDCIPAILSMIFGVDLTQVRLNPGTAVGVVFSREFCMLGKKKRGIDSRVPCICNHSSLLYPCLSPHP